MAFKDLMNAVKNETGDAIEITKLKAKISKDKSEIKENYEKIGEYIYNQFTVTGEADSELSEYVNAISAAKVRIREYNQEIDRVRMN